MAAKKNKTPPAAPITPPPAPAAPAKPALISKGAFKRLAFLSARATLKEGKAGIRAMVSKSASALITLAALSLMRLMVSFRRASQAVLLGLPTTPEYRTSLAHTIPIMLTPLFVIARATKAKIPSLARGKARGSLLDAVFEFDRVMGVIVDVSLTPGPLDVKITALSPLVTSAFEQAADLAKLLGDKNVAQLLTEYGAALEKTLPAQKPKGALNPEEAAKKAAAMKKALAAKAAKKAETKA